MRCSHFLLACLSVLVVEAHAFDRPFPVHAKRGIMSPAAFPEIVIDGKSRRLSPGARIWNEDNLIQMPASLRGDDLTVNYAENEQGEIERVWILTPDEARRALPKQPPS